MVAFAISFSALNQETHESIESGLILQIVMCQEGEFWFS
jgi:hypothetical protein